MSVRMKNSKGPLWCHHATAVFYQYCHTPPHILKQGSDYEERLKTWAVEQAHRTYINIILNAEHARSRSAQAICAGIDII